VVDDCSEDDTARIARSLGATVLTPPTNTGSRAGAQSYALPFVQTDFCIAINADTEVVPDSVGHLVQPHSDPDVAATCGFVLPRFVESVWERGRRHFGKLVAGPTAQWPKIWTSRRRYTGPGKGWGSSRMLFVTQSSRMTSIFFQNNSSAGLTVLSKTSACTDAIVHLPYLRSMVMVGIWDAIVASFVGLLILPLLAIFVHPAFLLGFIIDLPAVAVPVLAKGWQRGELGRVAASFPCFLIMPLVSAIFTLRAVWLECVIGRSLLLYEKGRSLTWPEFLAPAWGACSMFYSWSGWSSGKHVRPSQWIKPGSGGE
jgi:poly-beta-1,6-N-acetyl-D-glucosamine synthase